MNKDEALRLALEALERYVNEDEVIEGMRGNEPWVETKRIGEKAITAIKAALEAKDEPIGSFMTRLQAIDFLLKMRPQTEPTEKQIIATIDAYSALFGDMIESPVLPKQEAKDEPWEEFCDSHCVWTDHHPDCKLAQRTWVGLTDDDIEQEFGFIDELLRDCVQRTEAKLKEKNT